MAKIAWQTLKLFVVLVQVCLCASPPILHAEQKVVSSALGDPQLRTDHPWFPGELSCSTFERLFETQAALYQKQTGRNVASDEDKAIASWYWRNLNYYHAICPREPFWKDELTHAIESPHEAVMDYWTGLFGYGFSLCYTTHQQYTAEMEELLGRGRSRSVDVNGHTSFEVFLKADSYGSEGDWALLDHDISTIVFDDPVNNTRLINIADIAYATEPPDLSPRSVTEQESLLDNRTAPHGNRGWFKSGLYFPNEDIRNATDSDALSGVYTEILSTAPHSGYAGVPPMVTLKRNETIRRYLQPGLGGDTYVYWGPNYWELSHEDPPIPGPSRDRTWASQPGRMYGATQDTEISFARYGNVVYTYQPNFADGSYRDGVIAEDELSVTFYFYSPYAIAATPQQEAAKRIWAVLEKGCTEGLIVSALGNQECTVQVSTDNRSTWSPELRLDTHLDLTDLVKGHHSYHFKLNAPASELAESQIKIRTVCMANDRLMPHVKSGGTSVSFAASGKAVFAAGPNVDQIKRFVTSGGLGTDQIEMCVPTPNDAPLLEVHAAAIVNSGPAPDASVRYQIECSTNGGATWQPLVKNWRVKTMGYQVGDRAPQSYFFGNLDVSNSGSKEALVRFSNSAGITYERVEISLVYQVGNKQPVLVTFDWNEQQLNKSASHTFEAAGSQSQSPWEIETGEVTQTNWVEMKLAP